MTKQLQLSSTEITKLIKERIEHFETGPEVRREGTIVSVRDGVVKNCLKLGT